MIDITSSIEITHRLLYTNLGSSDDTFVFVFFPILLSSINKFVSANLNFIRIHSILRTGANHLFLVIPESHK